MDPLYSRDNAVDNEPALKPQPRMNATDWPIFKNRGTWTTTGNYSKNYLKIANDYPPSSISNTDVKSVLDFLSTHDEKRCCTLIHRTGSYQRWPRKTDNQHGTRLWIISTSVTMNVASSSTQFVGEHGTCGHTLGTWTTHNTRKRYT